MKVLGLMLASNNVEAGSSYGAMVEACKKTWHKNIPDNFNIFSVFADSYDLFSVKDKIKPNEYKVVDNDIIVNINESRDNLLKKTILGLEFLLNNYEFDYVFRPNCGSYINLNNLNKYLKDKPLKKYYDGPKNCLDWYKNIPYSSGSCMIFSRDVAELLVNDKDNMEYRCIDDTTIAIHLHKNNISLYTEKSWRPSGTDPFRLLMNTVEELDENFNKDTYHYYFRHTLNPNLIYRCHELTLQHEL
tara:strand:+ start:1817 stop:2551 length:735 start_codon:yes stop_codon:yes gene_type:complete